MNVVAKYSDQVVPLWDFFSQHLPSSLKAVKDMADYGFLCGVVIKERSDLPDILSFRHFVKPRIASISALRDEVELFAPQYYADFEDIIRKYEQQTGKSVTFIFWQSSKDKMVC